MKITKSQMIKMQAITELCEEFTDCKGKMVWSAEVSSLGNVCFSGTNIYADRKWYEQTEDLYCRIGKRGKVVITSGTLGKYLTHLLSGE